jgi:hypothetical protein
MVSRLNGSLESRQESMSPVTYVVTQPKTTLAIPVTALSFERGTKRQRRFKLVEAGIILCKGGVYKARKTLRKPETGHHG